MSIAIFRASQQMRWGAEFIALFHWPRSNQSTFEESP